MSIDIDKLKNVLSDMRRFHALALAAEKELSELSAAGTLDPKVRLALEQRSMSYREQSQAAACFASA
jgi:hypothetical protein